MEWDKHRGLVVLWAQRIIQQYPELKAQRPELWSEIETELWLLEPRWDGRVCFTTLAGVHIRNKTKDIVRRLTGRSFRGSRPKGERLEANYELWGSTYALCRSGDIERVEEKEHSTYLFSRINKFATPSERSVLQMSGRYQRWARHGHSGGRWTSGIPELANAVAGGSKTSEGKHIVETARRINARLETMDSVVKEVAMAIDVG